MSSPHVAKIVIMQPRGGSGGAPFSDLLLCSDITTAAIREITIWHKKGIEGIMVIYTRNELTVRTETLHGQPKGTAVTLVLDDDEYVAGVAGESLEYIGQLTFVTNKRTWGPYGNEHGKYFQWGDITRFPGTQVLEMRLLAFAGTCQGWLQSLQGIFLEQPGHNSQRRPNYEGIPCEASGSHETGTSVGPFSSFTSHLMTPVITLYAGQDSMKLHAHEDTLCVLPFFHAALHSGFQESLTRSIEMPDDDPRMVSVLIEYLYTGNYTYAYDSTKVDLQKETGTPIRDLTEGQYHVGVFVIASKYDSQALAEISIRNFEAILPNLNCVDELRLWRTAYREGPDVQSWRKSLQRCHSGGDLVPWVHELFEKHRDEIDQVIAESPELASDLLRLATGGVN